MLFDEDRLDEILELEPNDIAGYCDDYLDAETLSEHLAPDEPFFGRKELCRHLGVGESTLTGWLKEDRIPLMAKEAVILPLILRVLKNEIKRLRDAATDPQILQNGDIYQICIFEPDEAGEAIGKVVTDNISELDNARKILAGHQALKLLAEADAGPLDYAIEHFWDGEYENHYQSLMRLRKEIQMCISYAGDYETWRKANRPSTAKIKTNFLKRSSHDEATSVPSHDRSNQPQGGGS